MNKKLIRLTEQDLHKIVKESIDNIIVEFRTTYDNTMKKEMTKAFLKLEDYTKHLVGLLTGYQMPTNGMSLSEYAKRLGYTKSSKRFINALKYVEAAQKLIMAAKQDMLGDYNQPMGTNSTTDKIKQLQDLL